MGERFRRPWADPASAVSYHLARAKSTTQKDLETSAHGVQTSQPRPQRRQETAVSLVAGPLAKGTGALPLLVYPGNQVRRPVANSTFPRSVGGFAALAALFAVFLSATTPANGLEPSSREVATAVDRAIGFLSSDAATDARVGAVALGGLALIKHGASQSNPKVVAAARTIQTALAKADKPANLGLDVYSTGLATIFFIELDPQVYRPQIDFLLAYLRAIQKPHGGWGYPGSQTGDTSMTQYGVLSCWKATQAGIPVPPIMVEGMATWLLRTQDPSGGFGYQGIVSNTFDPVPQSSVRHSLSAAGLGSVYICADLCGISKREKEDKAKGSLPPAMKRVGVSPVKPRTSVPINIHPGLFQASFARGNNWMDKNFMVEPAQGDGSWIHYYFYALERYHSFRELAEGRTGTQARWYDEVARYLIDTQKANGSWQSQAGAVCDTAFGALFLLRSSKQAIEKAKPQDFGAGTLIGGRGLPKDSEIVKVRQGQVVATPKLEAVEKLLAATEDTDDSDFSEMVAVLPPEDARVLVSKHAKKLKQLSGDTSADARFAAVKTLGQSSDLDHVPTLIYALTDPEPAVVIEARNGLRRISRSFSGFGLPDDFSPADVEQAILRWKEWYLAIRPDAEFED